MALLNKSKKVETSVTNGTTRGNEIGLTVPKTASLTVSIVAPENESETPATEKDWGSILETQKEQKEKSQRIRDDHPELLLQKERGKYEKDDFNLR